MTGHHGRYDLPWLATCATVLVVPWAIGALGVNSVWLADVFAAPKWLALGITLSLAAAAIVWRIVRDRWSPRFNPAWWWAIGFLGWAGVSAVFAVNPSEAIFGGEARQGLVTLAMYVVLGLVVMQAADTPERVRTLQGLTVVGGIPVAVLALLQVVGLDPIDWGPGFEAWSLARGVSTAGNPDFLGGYLIFPVVMAVAYALTEERPSRRIAVWVAFALESVAWFATLSRGAWLGGLLGLVVLAAAAFRLGAKVRRGDALALGAGASAVLASAVALGSTAWSRAAGLLALGGSGTSGRLEIWRTALEAIPHHWFLGVGPDSFRYAFLPYRPAEYANLGASMVYQQDAHNYILQLAATVGLPGLALALAFLVALIGQAARIAFARGAGASRLAYAGWLAALVGYCGYLFFGPGRIMSNVVMWVAFGVLLSALATRTGEQWRARAVGVVTACLVIALAGTGAAVANTVASYHVVRSYEAPVDAALDEALAARSAMPWLLEYRFRVAEISGIDAMTAYSAGKTPAAQEAADRAIAAYEDLVSRFPNDYEALVVYANILNGLVPVRGTTSAEEALVMARRAQPLFPAGLHAKTAEAVALTNLGRYSEAVTVLEDVWDADPMYTEPGVRYAYALWLDGRPDDAREVLGELQRIAPRDEMVRALAAEMTRSGQQ